MISAVTETTPAIFPAFGCAPLIPPNPEVTNSLPAVPAPALSEVEVPTLSEVEVPALSEVEVPALSEVEVSIFLHPFNTVIVVP